MVCLIMHVEEEKEVNQWIVKLLIHVEDKEEEDKEVNDQVVDQVMGGLGSGVDEQIQVQVMERHAMEDEVVQDQVQVVEDQLLEDQVVEDVEMEHHHQKMIQMRMNDHYHSTSG